jgi:MOSC domain-containing protein YiiM
MNIEQIYTSPSEGGALVERTYVTVVAGKGIEGDRYFDHDEEPGQNITLIEAEEIEAFFAEQDRPCDLSSTRRNLVTRGVRVDELIGREFTIGEVRLRGVALCEPCMGLGGILEGSAITAAGVVRRFLHRAGIRADVLTDGVIARGAPLRLLGKTSIEPMAQPPAA